MAVLLNGTGVYKGTIKLVPWDGAQSRKERKDENFRQQASGHAMLNEDRDSHMQQWLLAMLNEDRDRHPTVHPKFLPGQSIIQWWASWFKEAEVFPEKYKKKQRPAWFSGEVLAHAGYKSMKYAGIQQEKQHVYVCY